MTKREIGTLCAVLAASVWFTGCGKQETAASDPLVLEVYDTLSDYEGLQGGWYASLLMEKFNIQLKFLTQEEKQARNLLEKAEPETLPDLILYSGEEGDLQKMTDAGNLYDMSGLLEGTEIADYKTALKWINEPLEAEGIYAIPGEVSRLAPETPSESMTADYGIYLRWDVYRQAGYPQINNMDGLLDIMEQMQKLLRQNGEQDVYALSLFREGNDSVLEQVSQIAGLFGYGRKGFVFAKAEEKEYQDVSEQDSWFAQACLWLREAYKRGLVDPDSFTQTKEEMDAKYGDGKAFLTIYPEIGEKYSSSSGNLADNQGMELAPVKGLKVLSKGCNPAGRQDMFLAMGSKVKEPERVMEFLNWFYSPEGIMISGAGLERATAGILGLTWEMEGGNPVLTQYGKQAFNGENPQVPEEWGGGAWEEGICQLNFRPVVEVEVCPSGFTYSYEIWETVEETEDSPLKQDWNDFMQAYDAVEYLMKGNQLLVIPGYWAYQEEEPESLSAQRLKCGEIIAEYFSRLVTASQEERFHALYREMVVMLMESGYEDVLEYDLKLMEKQKEYRTK